MSKFTEKAVFIETEEHFAHVINTIDTNAVAKGLRYCGIFSNNTWEILRQVLTIYRMSCLIVRVILCMDKPDFDKLCILIGNQEQVNSLSKLYSG